MFSYGNKNNFFVINMSQMFGLVFVENVSWLQWEKVEFIVPCVVEVWLEEKEHVQNGP